MLTLGSLFDGIGGWLLAAKHAGVTPVWASEIDDFPAAVTAHHFPDVKQLGDITKIDVDRLEPVDIICAGSPCQDLSVAGKREGLAGERSGLFRTAIKLVHRLRARTGKPRFFVWENVPGAFSSNRGADFRTVLEEISQTEIPMSANNKWADSGMVEWGGGSLAWRVLDAQYWGVPQRRKRIFLVADFGGHSAGEILFERKGVPGDSSQGGKARQGTSAGTQGGAHASSRMTFGFTYKASANARTIGYEEETSPTIATDGKHGVLQVDLDNQGTATRTESSTGSAGGIAIYDMTHANEVMRTVNGDKTNTLNARMGTGGNQVPVVSYAIAGNTINRQIQNGGNGKGVLEEKSYTLNTIDRHAVYCSTTGSFNNTQLEKSPALLARDYKQPHIVNPQNTIRKLTVTECERLQGLPDGWTNIEFHGKPASDSRRYKALGNGMAQPCADFVIRRIVESGKKGIDNTPPDVV